MPNGTQGETDIFAVFEAPELRFALHIENKPPDGKITREQAAAYRSRAAYLAFTEKWLNYADFETILLAPSAFVESHHECAEQFDRTICYEAVAEYAPLFADCLNQ